MVSTLRKLLNNIFDHGQENEDYPLNKKPISNNQENTTNVESTHQSHLLSIQKKKQLFAKQHVSDTNRKQYLKHLIEYDTREYIGISKHLTVHPITENKSSNGIKNEIFDDDYLLQFHCVYCHLLKVLLYHPLKYKSSSTKMVNAVNEYCKEYNYLSNKLGKSLNYILLNAEEDISKKGPIKNGYGISTIKNDTNNGTTTSTNSGATTSTLSGGLKKISIGKLNYLINNLEVNTADLYSYEHEFNSVTGEDLTLKKIIKENKQDIKLYFEEDSVVTNNDKVNTMLNWVIEDCYTLFMNQNVISSTTTVDEVSDEKSENSAGKAITPVKSFNYDCREALQTFKEQKNDTKNKTSVGKQVWMERRRKQYEFYAKETKEEEEDDEEKAEPESCLIENGIRPVSYLKIYELLVTGISIKQHMNLRDFMIICFVGWMHDGKWEDGIRA
ncbi:hypothetical protein HANVADRAFT_51289 [Hanseniaspora valbyensis NRRL Y-1626]|uniref:Gag1-like clamp domain-containing protein n=1 Tax=Hanseniaspora valbyensis NRRL Y-1626 TaxID=766949 RepID=A0A1B7TJE8_9ASCO|nr:hypothetical protein HANVADRAFT_51289 [Hanseniaspora valbyensis NRRL Y-1626]